MQFSVYRCYKEEATEPKMVVLFNCPTFLVVFSFFSYVFSVFRCSVAVLLFNAHQFISQVVEAYWLDIIVYCVLFCFYRINFFVKTT